MILKYFYEQNYQTGDRDRTVVRQTDCDNIDQNVLDVKELAGQLSPITFYQII